MAEERLGPEILSTRGVPSARRGYDKRVVDALLQEAARHWKELVAQHEELQQLVEENGGIEFLGREMGEFGREVGEILEAAKEAAEGMRARARADADELEKETRRRMDELLAEAEQQAFQLRKDAWETGTEVMEAALEEEARIIARGEDDALLIRANAEREAHRLVSAGRKEGDELMRSARYEADRQLNQAREIAQQIIDRAAQPVAAGLDETDDDSISPERRRELLSEIEHLRAQRSIEAVEVFSSPPPRQQRRTTPRQAPEEPETDLSDELAADVEQMRGESTPEVVQIRTNEPVQFGTEDDVGTLFEALRTTDEIEAVAVPEPEPERTEPLSTDPFELREQLLVPVINSGVREVKRRIVDMQNIALDGLRNEGWEPDAPEVRRHLHAALEPMIHTAASEGATAAGPLAGVTGAVSTPGERAPGLVGDMAAALAGGLGAAVEEGGGPEMLAAAVSRVFREWRTDTADRWVHFIAITAYHDSLLAALSEGGVDRVTGVGSGSACDECPGREGESWVPGGAPPEGMRVPPAHPSCACSFIPAAG